MWFLVVVKILAGAETHRDGEDKKHLAREDDDEDDDGESGEGGEGCGIKWKHAATAAAKAARSKLRRRRRRRRGERRGKGRFVVDGRGATTAKIARFDAARSSTNRVKVRFQCARKTCRI